MANVARSLRPLRHRIKDHRRVRAGDLLAHELNYRKHPASQVAALQAIYDEVGFARSLLAYELPDGRLKLIDGHLRREMHPDELLEVEVLDLNEDEARKLLLSIDPLAALALNDGDTLDELRQLVQTDEEVLRDFWKLAEQDKAATAQEPQAKESAPSQFLIVITCSGEEEQRELLDRFTAQGLQCRALLG